jgi:hypothetical protein
MIDLKDIIGAKVIGGVEGGRSDAFHWIYIQCKDGKKYRIEAPDERNMVLIPSDYQPCP